MNEVSIIERKLCGVDAGSSYLIRFEFANKSSKIGIFNQTIVDKYFSPVKDFDEVYFHLFGSDFVHRYSLFNRLFVDITPLSFIANPSAGAIYDMMYQINSTILTSSIPIIGLISEKGTLKSFFTSFVTDEPGITVIDSDDYGIALTEAFIQTAEYLEGDYLKGDTVKSIGIFYLWLEEKFKDWRISIDKLSPDEIWRVNTSSYMSSSFNDFWSKCYDKGIGTVPSFKDYVANIIKVNNPLILIVLCHNHSEARMITTTCTAALRTGLKTSEILEIRALKKEELVSQYLANLVIQEYCQAQNDVICQTIGWGDVIHLLLHFNYLQ